MKLSILLTLAFGILFTQIPAWAKVGESDQHQREMCEGVLGHTVVSVAPNLVFDVIKGIGGRGLLGSYPVADAQAVEQAAAQGVKFWGHSIAVHKNVISAANHDAQFRELSKISYLISDVDVSDLTDDSDPALVQARFTQAFENGQLIYFDEVDGRQTVQSIAKEDARRIIHPKSIIWFSKDNRGPRFHQLGWTFPKVRGVLTYQNVFESDSNKIYKVQKEARALERKGYTFTFNQDFLQALNKARDQVRIEKTGAKDAAGVDILKAVPEGSRYRGEQEYQMAFEGYKKGTNVSVEVRDPSGRMVAGIIGHHYGNVWSWETVFYDFTTRDGSRYFTAAELAAMADAREARSLIDLAKMAAVAALLRMHDHGLDVADAGMVTPFTAGLKGVYVPAEDYLKMMAELNSRPLVNVDIKKPFSFLARQQPAQE